MRALSCLAAGTLLLAAAMAQPSAAQAQQGAGVFAAQRGQAQPPRFDEQDLLADIIASETRSDADRARDAHRRPYEALTFWGLQPGMTIVEIEPGVGGWWTEILGPYAAQTGGQYVAAWIDLANPATSDGARTARANLEQRLAGERYGQGRAVNFGPQSGLDLPDGSADFILVARAFHNWARAEGRTDQYMSEFYRVLRPGGILAIEQHRAEEGLGVADTAPTGYVPESYVIQAGQRAGFALDGRSELNANARDTRDHPFGVWTLPPVRRDSQDGRTLSEAERARFDAIGESDRMTLRFRKPE